jgi:hypothetical protein
MLIFVDVEIDILRNQAGDGLEIVGWFFIPDFRNGSDAVFGEVISQRIDKIFAQLVAAAFRAAPGIARLTWLEFHRLFPPVVSGKSLAGSHHK